MIFICRVTNVFSAFSLITFLWFTLAFIVIMYLTWDFFSPAKFAAPLAFFLFPFQVLSFFMFSNYYGYKLYLVTSILNNCWHQVLKINLTVAFRHGSNGTLWEVVVSLNAITMKKFVLRSLLTHLATFDLQWLART